MNLAEARTLTLTWLDDVGAGYFTTAQVNVFLNNAQKTLQKKLLRCQQNYYLKCIQTTTVIGQQDYVFPSDFKKLHRLEIVLAGTGTNESRAVLKPFTLQQSDFSSLGPGTPEAYYMKQNRLVLWPIPDQAYTLRLYYSYEVADMVNDTDVIDAPESYAEYVPILAAQDGFIKDGRSSALLDAKAKFYEELIMSDAQERNIDFPRTVVQMDLDSIAGNFLF
jgi:hypothetical protein